MKKLIMFIMTLVMCLSLCACEKADDYEVAVALMDAGKYEEAMSAFEQLGEYEDSAVKATVSFDGKETQPELKAEAKHTMKGKNGASTFRNVGTCLWDIASYEADTPVKWTEYIHIGTDGEMDDTRSAPAFDSRVTMQRTIIAASLEQLIEDADCGVSMADLGFTNY